MTIQEAEKLLSNDQANRNQLLRCLEDLCKEYGWVQKTPAVNARDKVLIKKTLDEMQLLIDQLQEKLK